MQIKPGSEGEADCQRLTEHAIGTDGMCACGKRRFADRAPGNSHRRADTPRFWRSSRAELHVIRDRDHANRPLRFHGRGYSPYLSPMNRDDADAWVAALNEAADDEPAGIFALTRLTRQPTAATREVVAEVLAGEQIVVLPWASSSVLLTEAGKALRGEAGYPLHTRDLP